MKTQAELDMAREPSDEQIENLTGYRVNDHQTDAKTVEDELQAELEDLLAGTCSVCGRSVEEKHRNRGLTAIYCQNCSAMDSDQKSSLDQMYEGTTGVTGDNGDNADLVRETIRPFSPPDSFSAVPLVKESWRMTHGVKGSIWAGVVVMFLVIFSCGGIAVYLLSHEGPRAGAMIAAWLKILSQVFSTILSLIFLAGLITIGIHRVAGRSFSWNLVFSGFSRLGSIVIAGFLMSLLITSGFFLFVLPGVYLTVGYSLTLPLIMDRGAGPWEAMELSRQAVHKWWWQVFGAYLLMYLVYVLSMIPFGLGMIWTVPMFFTLTAVIYRVLLGKEAD